jgi:hypothetical protein
MTSEEQKEYRTLVRGAATYVLLGSKYPPMSVLELVRLYKLDPAIVSADVEAIVQSELSKAGGVFEDLTRVSKRA